MAIRQNFELRVQARSIAAFTNKTRQRRSGPALRNAPYIFKLSTEVDFVFDNMLEVSAIGREHHLNPEGSLAFKGPLPNDTLDLLLRCYTNVLQEFAQ